VVTLTLRGRAERAKEVLPTMADYQQAERPRFRDADGWWRTGFARSLGAIVHPVGKAPMHDYGDDARRP
jgi:hypothetical protein